MEKQMEIFSKKNENEYNVSREEGKRMLDASKD